MKKLLLLLFFGFMGWAPLMATSLQEQVERETAKREQMLQPLQAAFTASKKMVADGQSAQGCEALEIAYQALPETLRDTALAIDVQRTLAKLQAALSEAAAQKNHWPEARRRALSALQYDPSSEKALAQLQHSDEVLRRGTVGGPGCESGFNDHFFRSAEYCSKRAGRGTSFAGDGPAGKSGAAV